MTEHQICQTSVDSWSVGFVFRTLPILESPYPMLVLVGPQGVGKKTLAQKLVEDLPDYFGYA